MSEDQERHNAVLSPSDRAREIVNEPQKSVVELQHRIERAIAEAVEGCADLADSIGKDFVSESLEAPNEKSKETYLGWANGAFQVRDAIRKLRKD